LKRRVEGDRQAGKATPLERGYAVLSYDEFGPLEVKPEKGANWAPQGKPDLVPATYHRTEGVWYLHAAYDLSEDKMYGHVKPRKTHVEFLGFLRYLRSLYPILVILYVILDNASAHMVTRVLEYARKHRIRLVFTPTNASWLNPIESHFASLRRFAISNSNPKSHEEIARNIRRFIAWRNRHHPEQSPPRKRRTTKKPRLCGKCGIIILEEH
jgi:transposase